MIASRAWLGCVALVGVLATSALNAEERFAVVITGASAGETYAQKYRTLRESLPATLRDTF
jgi:hypothetical protein